MSFTALRRLVTFASLALAVSACCGGGGGSKKQVSCTYDTDCSASQVCRGELTGTASYCAPISGTPTGGTCDDRDDCDHGSCLKKVGEDANPGICSKHCRTPSDCPAGFQTCLSISDSGGVKYCLPGNANYGAPPSKKKTTTVVKPPATPGTPGTAGGPPGGRPPGPIKKLAPHRIDKKRKGHIVKQHDDVAFSHFPARALEKGKSPGPSTRLTMRGSGRYAGANSSFTTESGSSRRGGGP